ncbi:MAG: Ig-like domain-containing protein [Anaerolineae bacterium]|nr:Ig-like domain-containing protein [Anaerolineae bacterium]
MTPTPSAPQSPPPALRLSRFDGVVAVVMAVLLVGILLTILMGDRVGVQVERYGPGDNASSTARITLTFNEPMDAASVTGRLQFDPPLEGEFGWNGKTLRFTPAQPLTPGQTYAVTLRAGAQGSSGRQVLEDVTFNFRVRTPRVAYLMPADSTPQNIWIATPGQPDSAGQATFSPTGILNFDVSPDGTKIAFAERTQFATASIKLLDLANGSIEQLTNCPDSDCNTPVWRPDGTLIAYHRIDLNSDISQVGASPTRIWLIDLTTTPASERPLFSDNQILGYSPQWSADGSKIALFDNNNRGILVYSFTDGSTTLVPSRSGSDIALSPDGTQLVFPRLIFDDAEGGARSVLQLADLRDGQVVDLVDPELPVDDTQPVWNPDGRHLAISRRYTDSRATRTRQLSVLDVQTGEVEDIISDPRYSNGFFSWSPQGEQLVVQRFPELTESGDYNSSGRPEIWTYNLRDSSLIQIEQNAYLPRWVP